MAEERVQRRLAAILAADVVGYSRMMREDEIGTPLANKNARIAWALSYPQAHEDDAERAVRAGVGE